MQDWLREEARQLELPLVEDPLTKFNTIMNKNSSIYTPDIYVQYLFIYFLFRSLFSFSSLPHSFRNK